jgi:hypothetical protein
MCRVILFAKQKVDPQLFRFPEEHQIERLGLDSAQELPFGEISRQIDISTRERVAVLVSVLGLTYLTELCVDCALAEIIKLCERPDVYAVLDAYHHGKAALKRKAG